MRSHLSLSAALIVLLGLSSSLLAQKIDVYPVSPDNSANPLPPSTLEFQETGEAKSDARPYVVRVDRSQRFQTMDGFGASLTDSAAWLLERELPPAERKRVMKALFDPNVGAGISFLRQPLGASDLSRTHYSYDDRPAGQTDPGVHYFSIAHDKDYILPSVREALRINPAITVMVTPWSPPGWMKTHDTMIGGSLKEDALANYATYLVKSVQAYQHAGVPVRYLSVQNEPLYETKNYPGTLMLAAQQKHLIGDYLGPALTHAGLKTQILAYDHNWDHPEYPLEVLAYPPAARYLAGTAFHCYGGDPSAQTPVHDAHPAMGLWMTECSGGAWQKGNLLGVTAKLVIESTRNWARSVVLWGMFLDTDNGPYAGGCSTCRALVTVDRKNSPHTASFTIDYYALGAASRWVRPGAVRIASTDLGREALETVAFQNTDGSVALLVFNNGAADTKFLLEWQGKNAHAEIPAGALATYVWR
jgi:glucosylceramidase